MKLFNTDHKAVIAIFYTQEIFDLKNEAQLKKNQLTKKIFLYNQTTDQQWSDFVDQIEQKLMTGNFNSKDNINTKWNILHNSIYNSAKNNVPNKIGTIQEN